MSGLKRTVGSFTDRFRDRSLLSGVPDFNKLKDSFANPLVPIKDTISDVSGIFTPDVIEPEELPVIPIPDEQTAAVQARKRRAKASGSGRESTILTEGLGG